MLPAIEDSRMIATTVVSNPKGSVTNADDAMTNNIVEAIMDMVMPKAIWRSWERF